MLGHGIKLPCQAWAHAAELLTGAELPVLASMPAQAGSILPGGAGFAGIAGLLAAVHPALQAVQAGEVPMHLLLQILSRSVGAFWH